MFKITLKKVIVFLILGIAAISCTSYSMYSVWSEGMDWFAITCTGTITFMPFLCMAACYHRKDLWLFRLGSLVLTMLGPILYSTLFKQVYICLAVTTCDKLGAAGFTISAIVGTIALLGTLSFIYGMVCAKSDFYDELVQLTR